MLRICLLILNVCLVISCAGSSLSIPEPPDDGYDGYNVTGFNFLVEKGPRSVWLEKQFNISAENCRAALKRKDDVYKQNGDTLIETLS